MVCLFYSLAKSQSYNDGLIDIFTQYGDHLYSKNDYDGAIAQYIRTIGKLEPSYVIRKVITNNCMRNITCCSFCLVPGRPNDQKFNSILTGNVM